MFSGISPQLHNKFFFLIFREVGEVSGVFFSNSSMTQFLQISQPAGRDQQLDLDTAHTTAAGIAGHLSPQLCNSSLMSPDSLANGKNGGRTPSCAIRSGTRGHQLSRYPRGESYPGRA